MGVGGLGDRHAGCQPTTRLLLTMQETLRGACGGRMCSRHGGCRSCWGPGGFGGAEVPCPLPLALQMLACAGSWAEEPQPLFSPPEPPGNSQGEAGPQGRSQGLEREVQGAGGFCLFLPQPEPNWLQGPLQQARETPFTTSCPEATGSPAWEEPDDPAQGPAGVLGSSRSGLT